MEIEHPSGKIAIDLDADFANGKEELRRAALIRTARRIFEGRVFVPKHVWAGPDPIEDEREIVREIAAV
jgi:2-methylaconitate cis-trans-isomerase PrpF